MITSLGDLYLDADIPFCAKEWRNKDFTWFRQYTLISTDQQLRWNDAIKNDPTIKMFSLCCRDEDTPIGVCGLTSIDRINQKAEMSFYINETPYRSYENEYLNGIMLLLGHAFYDHNLNRIWAECLEGSPMYRRLRMLEFMHEGTHTAAYYRNGKFIASDTLAITKGIFNAGHGHRFSNDNKHSGPASEPSSDNDPLTNAKEAFRAGFDSFYSGIEYGRGDIGSSNYAAEDVQNAKISRNGSWVPNAGEVRSGSRPPGEREK